jgi:tetratricopeptide (TPR) repeat protein
VVLYEESLIMKRIFILLVVLVFAASGVEGRTNRRDSRDQKQTRERPGQKTRGKKKGFNKVELTVYPSKPASLARKYYLLPTAKQKSDSDAVNLYEKAVQSLPSGNRQTEQQIREMAETPVNKLPIEEAQSILKKYSGTIDLVTQAGLCRECKWPAVEAGQVSQEVMGELSKYRRIALVLALKTRVEMAQGKYEKAIETIQTGLAAGKNIGDNPILIQGMVGVAISAVILKQADELVQCSGEVNLYDALAELPRPLVDINKSIEAELASLDSNPKYNVLVRKMMKKQWEPAHKKVRLTMNRLDQHVAVLQCVEALRLYAGAHDGKLPDSLNAIKEIAIPDDPVTKKAFVYSSTATEAVLKGPAPKGIDPEEALEYKVTLKKQL